MSDLSLSQYIKDKAADIGFSLCRITSATPPHYHKYYRQWLDDGFAGEMQYLHRQEPKRSNPSLVLDNVTSIVCVALNYYKVYELDTVSYDPATIGKKTIGDGAYSGTVARYAQYDDYHNVMWRKLEDLLECIKKVSPNVNGKAYCDTGPITERDLAMRAGIGWIGKHTNLISRKLGNWFFLGEIYLDIELSVDTPEEPHCGTCSRCIPACPTSAITAPYRLDARRCISYLTIELKTSIPEELRPLIGNRIYGCDDCLNACPWNKFAVNANEGLLIERLDLNSPNLLELLSITDEEFNNRFANSPVKRTKRKGLLRNVCVALGNIAGDDAIPHLNDLINRETDELIIEHAEWAIKQITNRSATR